jgi:hypothetical protein
MEQIWSSLTQQQADARFRQGMPTNAAAKALGLKF